MKSGKGMQDFLREVDEDLLIYAGELRGSGFTSTASAKYLRENDLAGIPEGHKILKYRQPYVKDRKLGSRHPQRKVQLLNLQRGKKTVLSDGDASVGQEAQWSQSEASVSRPTIR